MAAVAAETMVGRAVVRTEALAAGSRQLADGNGIPRGMSFLFVPVWPLLVERSGLLLADTAIPIKV